MAGIAFAVLFALAITLLNDLPVFEAGDAAIEAWFAAGDDITVVVSALYLLPFAAIAFLWFLAVVRDQIGEREDRFFGTVFYGSGILFVALLLTSAGVIGSMVVGVRFLGQEAPSAETFDTIQAMGYTLLLMIGSRAVALFVLSTATIGLRFGVFPRWFVLVGYAIGLILLLVVTFWELVMYVVSAWVLLVSLFILRRAPESQATSAEGAPA